MKKIFVTALLLTVFCAVAYQANSAPRAKGVPQSLSADELSAAKDRIRKINELMANASLTSISTEWPVYCNETTWFCTIKEGGSDYNSAVEVISAEIGKGGRISLLLKPNRSYYLHSLISDGYHYWETRPPLTFTTNSSGKPTNVKILKDQYLSFTLS